MLSVWKIDDGGESHWVVAESEADAKAVLKEDMIGCGIVDYSEDDIVSVEQLPLDAVLGIRDDDGIKHSKTCDEWVAENGRDYLCGTCW